MKSYQLTTKHIDETISKLRKQGKSNTGDELRSLILPIATKILSKRYKGFGRPRKVDYDYKKINWRKILSKNNATTKKYMV